MKTPTPVRERYRKDPDYETFLARFNEILAPYQEEEYQDLPEVYPTVHVTGAPRSGTTVMAQLIASHLPMGCINNLIGAFWRAPVFGIQLSKQLIPPGLPSSLRSDFGRTATIHELHEFAYFWSDVLGYPEYAQQPDEFEEQIQWDRLRRVLINMTHAFGSAVLFKSFLLGFHIARVQAILPKTCFIRVRRNPVDNALSLLRFRQSVMGSLDDWVTLKPLEYESLRHEPFCRQVAGQVYFLEQSLTRQIEEVGGHNVLDVEYEQLCRNPKAVLEDVRDMLLANGQAVEITGDVPESLPVSRKRNFDPAICARVEQAVREHYQHEDSQACRDLPSKSQRTVRR